MDQQYIDIVNQLLEHIKPGVSVPETITDIDQLSQFVSLAIGVSNSLQESKPAKRPGQSKPAKPTAGQPAVAMSLKSIRSSLSDLGRQVRELRSTGGSSRRNAVAMSLPAQRNELQVLVDAGLLTVEQAQRQAGRLG